MGHTPAACLINCLNNNNNNNNNDDDDDDDDDNNNNTNRIERHYSTFVTIPSLHHELSPTPTLKSTEHNLVQILCSI